ncbi:MAG: hypothetical protein JNM30_02665 [Rhodospirillales bacterium]|nr:hypothetical protein [Rhodospirillales bacterium]
MLGDLYIQVVDSFLAVIGLGAQFFLMRPWLLPIVPVVLLVLGYGWRARRVAQSGPARGHGAR